jgi:hypothetical protein
MKLTFAIKKGGESEGGNKIEKKNNRERKRQETKWLFLPKRLA